MATLKDLPKALSRVERQLLTAVAQMQSNVAGGISVELAKQTPVKTGYAQSNWFVELNEVFPSRDYITYDAGEVRDGPGFRLARNDALRKATSMPQRIMRADGRGTKPLFIGNVTPYLRYLNDGSSVQAPANFIPMTARQAFRQAVRDVPSLFQPQVPGGF